MESSSRKSSPLWETDWQDKVESYWLTGVSHLGSFRRVGVESSSRKSSPPPESEYLAAPQNKGIPRRPPNLNISPPLKTREYLAAPPIWIPRRPPKQGNTSPPPSLNTSLLLSGCFCYYYYIPSLELGRFCFRRKRRRSMDWIHEIIFNDPV